MKTGLITMPGKHEGWSRYQNSTGEDLPKSTLETENHVLKDEHINPIKSCLIRDDLHMRAQLHSRGRFLPPALKEIQRTRAKRLLQQHAESGPENILFTDEKIFTIKEPYNNQNNKIYAQTSLEVRSEGAGGHHPSYIMVWWRVSHQRVTPLHFCEKHVKTGAQVYQEDVLQGVMNPIHTTVFDGQKWVIQQDSAPAHKARRLRRICGERSGLYQHQGLALGGVLTSSPWIINCGLFQRTWLAESVTSTWTAWRDPLWTQC